ncbi:hypothetical protein GK047_14025 [Paenibacillus sp. SYP-B3998]|uniref:Uncharacterized protein n=1 Tax=Paenibacillus sp. SYP-B3998 TaxID=2678564 RepID=A0A6G3ZZX4_9BACL|nr:hypothetical protein [Paenibacillus sp. SYP-B3998]NEW07121.1 hypothetical protein [Paenibacillus sp. SYP-B3998]
MSKPVAWSHDFYKIEEQRKRKDEIFQMYAQQHGRFFSDDGSYIGADIGFTPRPSDLMNCCVTYLFSRVPAAVEKSNQVLRRLDMIPCHFLPFYSLLLLKEVPELLHSDIVEKLEAYSRGQLDDFVGSDHDFVGVNDNFPCVSAFTIIAGGLRYGRPELIEKGKQRIGQLASMMRRRGSPSEYNSPSYTILQIHALAAIAELKVDEEMTVLALQCEERIWVEYLSHMFLPVGRLAGPYSRSYMPTLTEYGVHPAVLYMLFGEEMEGEGLTREEREVLFGQADHHLLAVDFHLPSALAQWFLQREYPFAMEATTEYNASTDEVVGVQKLWSDPSKALIHEAEDDRFPEYASGIGRISTYMTRQYSLGVASHEWHCGSQTDTFLALYTSNTPNKGRKDVRMLFSRYSVNDALPGQTNKYEQLGTTNGPFLFWDQGRKVGVHHESTAMMLYKPRAYARKNVTSLRLMLILPIKDGEPDEIWMGEQPWNPSLCSQESVDMCPVYIKDGQVYTAISPLVPSNHGRKRAVRIEKQSGYIILSFYNYEGVKRDFTKDEFLLTGNGFVAELGSEQQYGSFQAFKQIVSTPVMKDEYLSNVHMRGTTVRQTVFERAGCKLACEYSPISEGIRYLSVNDRPLGHIKLAATGLDEKRLPFM